MDLPEKKGVHRVENGWGNENSVVVSWGAFDLITVPESHYRTQNYQPPFDELPWKESKSRF